MNDQKTIGKIVREIRKSSTHRTQEAFAELIDVSTETVSNIERGLVFLNTQTLSNISEKCNVATDYILGSNSYDDTLSQLSPELIESWEKHLEASGISKVDFVEKAIRDFISENEDVLDLLK